ncbi:hypothetical protein [Rhodococcoides fascians]|uniref:hypothetical protein n=1 Tax=Rhodococcoides fascians TaxID=1828 RepID=UPI0005230A5D|nr:hypothetical protein [Rhodococcus fascians]
MSTVNQRRIRKMARDAEDRYILNRACEAFDRDLRDAEIWTDQFVQQIAERRKAEKETTKPWWRFWI